MHSGVSKEAKPFTKLEFGGLVRYNSAEIETTWKNLKSDQKSHPKMILFLIFFTAMNFAIIRMASLHHQAHFTKYKIQASLLKVAQSQAVIHFGPQSPKKCSKSLS